MHRVLVLRVELWGAVATHRPSPPVNGGAEL